MSFLRVSISFSFGRPILKMTGKMHPVDIPMLIETPYGANKYPGTVSYIIFGINTANIPHPNPLKNHPVLINQTFSTKEIPTPIIPIMLAINMLFLRLFLILCPA